MPCANTRTSASSTLAWAASGNAATAKSSSTAVTAAGMAESSCLEVRDVGLAFGGLRVLQDLSFATRDAELLCLIGPNGAGKTSVLNCVCGIYRPSGGRIAFEGRELASLAPHAIARLGLARTFQHGELMPHLSVIENLLVARHTRFTT